MFSSKNKSTEEPQWYLGAENLDSSKDALTLPTTKSSQPTLIHHGILVKSQPNRGNLGTSTLSSSI